MPTLLDRDARAAELARIMRRLSVKSLAKLKALMGTPPDPRRIGVADWLAFQREAEEKTRPWYLLFLLGAAGGVLGMLKDQLGYDPDPFELEREAELWAQGRAATLARGVVTQTQERIEAAAVAYRQGDIDQAELEARIDRTASPERMDSIGHTEATHAQTGGGRIAGDRFEAETGGKVLKIWRHREKIGATHPCPLCLPLVNTEEHQWASIDPEAAEGPPRHVNCDCEIEELVVDAAEWELIQGERRDPRGGRQSYADAFRRIKDSRGSSRDK